MLILELQACFTPMILWFLKRMNPLEIRKNESMKIMDCCFFHETCLHQGLLVCSNRTRHLPSTYIPCLLHQLLPLAPNISFLRITILPRALSPPSISQPLYASRWGGFSNLYLRHQLFCSHLLHG